MGGKAHRVDNLAACGEEEYRPKRWLPIDPSFAGALPDKKGDPFAGSPEFNAGPDSPAFGL
jgi:hypothetical protein